MLKRMAFAILAPALLLGADVTGTWDFQVQTDAGTGTPTFVLKQQGEKLSGKYSGMLGEAEVRGTVKGDEVVIEFDTEATGQKATVRYAGKLEGDRKMQGKVGLGEYSGTFTATKKGS